MLRSLLRDAAGHRYVSVAQDVPWHCDEESTTVITIATGYSRWMYVLFAVFLWSLLVVSLLLCRSPLLLSPPPANPSLVPPVGPPVYLSDTRGYVALVYVSHCTHTCAGTCTPRPASPLLFCLGVSSYSGTIRTFPDTFASHLVNVYAPCPYTIHVFMHAMTDMDQRLQVNKAVVTGKEAVEATLDYYRAYLNLDNQSVSLREAVKSFIVEPESPQQANKRHGEALDIIRGRSIIWKSAINVLSALYSLQQANTARLTYGERHLIDYQYVIRLRYDQIFRTNIWSSLFNISHVLDEITDSTATDSTTAPVSVARDERLWQPDGISTYELADLRYRSILRADQPIVPSCERFEGGINDQFFISNSSIFNAYSTRGSNVALLRQLATESSWQFHAERYVQDTLRHYGLSLYQIIDVCYSVLRAGVRRVTNADMHFGYECSFRYGEQCCASMCAQYTRWQNKLSLHISQNRSVQQSTGSQLVSSSTSWYLHASSNPLTLSSCDPIWWSADTPAYDMYHFEKLPFLVTDPVYLPKFVESKKCLSS